MQTLTNVQTIIGPDGNPAYAVIPYAEYLRLSGGERDNTIPNEVAGRVIMDEMSPARAWREHLNLTQAEIASRLGITQSAYAQQENSAKRPRKASREKLAAAFGLLPEQLDF